MTLSTAARNAITARTVAPAWFLELFCAEGTLRCWDQFESISYDGATFEPIGSDWEIAGEIRVGSGLVAEPLTMTFDGGRQFDDASFVGRLLDRTWHLRDVRLRCVVFNTASNFMTPIDTVFDWVGFMNTISVPEGGSGKSIVVLNCESDTFRTRARNIRTVTDADQRLRDPNDASFKNIATKPFQDVPFGVGWSTIPGAIGGSVGGVPSGGSGTGNRFNPSLF